MRRPSRALLALLLPAFLSACRHKAETGSKLETLVASEVTRTWRLRARLDSGEVHAEVTSAAASMTVIAPTGTFLLAYDRSDPIEDWARAIARLSRAPMADGTSESIVIRATFDERVAGQFTRHAGRSGAPFTLAGTNSAWEFAIDLTAAQLDAVVAALTGDSTGAAVSYESPSGRRGPDARPLLTGAWLYMQVDTPVEGIDGPEGLQYPTAVAGAPNGGEVKLSCTVGADGRVIPSSIFLIMVPDPVLAREARSALLRARFVPARRGGDRVPMAIQIPFRFGRP